VRFHVSYSGRDFGRLVNGSNQALTGTVTGNYGWAVAADTALAFDAALAQTRDVALSTGAPGIDELTYRVGADNLYLGDSHKGRAF